MPVLRREDDYCIECSSDGQAFSQMRVCHMPAAADEISFGIYACSTRRVLIHSYFLGYEDRWECMQSSTANN